MMVKPGRHTCAVVLCRHLSSAESMAVQEVLLSAGDSAQNTCTNISSNSSR